MYREVGGTITIEVRADKIAACGRVPLELSGGPSALRPAFLRLTAPFSLLGVPTVSLPLKIEMLSAGIQIVGRWGEDAKVLSVALELESRLSKL